MKKKAATKKAKDKTSAPEVELACTVIADHTKIGSMICMRGTKARLPEAKAKALEKLGKVRIDGVC